MRDWVGLGGPQLIPYDTDLGLLFWRLMNKVAAPAAGSPVPVSGNCISEPFRIEINMIVVTVCLLVMNPTEFHWVS